MNKNSPILLFALFGAITVVLCCCFLRRLYNIRYLHVRYKARETDRAFLELHLSHLENNVRVLQSAMPPACQLMAVVKAQAYGHSAFPIAIYLKKLGVHAFAVATIDEGIHLRKCGISGEILVLGHTAVQRAAELKKYNLQQTLIDLDYANALNAQNVPLKAHLKIDTGMHRLGIDSSDLASVQQVFSMKNLKICGVYTHLCCADSMQPEDIAFSREQTDRFYRLIETLKAADITVPRIHLQSSYGLINYPGLSCDYIRAGIALYGVPSAPTNAGLWPKLLPVLSLKSRVVLIRSVPAGESIGYNRSFTASRDIRIAVLSIGYADGLPRNLSETDGQVMLRGQYAPIVGRICMDQLTVDVTELADVRVGDLAELISADPSSQLTAPLVAARTGSISNELLSRLGARLSIRISD